MRAYCKDERIQAQRPAARVTRPVDDEEEDELEARGGKDRAERRRRRQRDDDDDRPRRKRKAQRDPAAGWIMIVGGAGLFLVLVGMVLVVVMLAGRRDRDGAVALPGAGNVPVAANAPLDKGMPPAVPALQPAALRMSLDCRDTTLKQVLVQRTRVLSHYTAQKPGGAPPAIAVHELATGKRLMHVPLDAALAVEGLDLCPDGSHVAVSHHRRAGAGLEIDVYRVPDGKAVVRDWLPQGKGGPPQELVWMALLDAERLLTVTASGQFAVWNLGTRQATVRGAVGARSLSIDFNRCTRLPMKLAVSGDRRLLALFNEDGFTFFDLSDGKVAGKTQGMAGAGKILNVWGAAFSPDGKALAASFNLHRNQESRMHLARWAVDGGRREALHHIGKDLGFAAGLTWWGDQHVVLWNGVLSEGKLYDTATGMLCRHCQRLQYGRFANLHVDERAWYATGAAPLDPAILTAVELPRADLAQFPPQPDAVKPWYFRPDGIAGER